MRFRVLAAVGAAVAFLLAVPGVAEAQAKDMKKPTAKEITLTGTVIDVSCKFGHGLSGADHRMCSQVCADRGIPLAILGSDGKLYVPITAGMPGDGQNALLRDHAEHEVRVTGKVFEAGGANAIQIEKIAMKS